MSTFVCSDIHGQFTAWMEAIKKSGIDLEHGDNLVILGDLIDKGKNSLECMKYAFELQENYPEQVTYLLGNHEDMMLNFVSSKNPLYTLLIGESWFVNGGDETIKSFLGYIPSSFAESKYLLQEKYSLIIKKIQSLPVYKVDEEHQCVYVHAGFKSETPLNMQSKDTMIWIRQPFLEGFHPAKNDVLEGKLIVHGHTPVQIMGNYTGIEYSGHGYFRGKHHLNVDGGAGVGEKIIIVNIDDFSYIEEKI